MFNTVAFLSLWTLLVRVKYRYREQTLRIHWKSPSLLQFTRHVLLCRRVSVMKSLHCNFKSHFKHVLYPCSPFQYSSTHIGKRRRRDRILRTIIQRSSLFTCRYTLRESEEALKMIRNRFGDVTFYSIQRRACAQVVLLYIEDGEQHSCIDLKKEIARNMTIALLSSLPQTSRDICGKKITLNQTPVYGWLLSVWLRKMIEGESSTKSIDFIDVHIGVFIWERRLSKAGETFTKDKTSHKSVDSCPGWKKRVKSLPSEVPWIRTGSSSLRSDDHLW